MKHLITFLLSLFTITSYGQVASRILPSQSVPKDSSVRNFVWVDNTPFAMNRLWVANMDSVRMYPWNMRWLNDSVFVWGDSRYPQLLGSYTDPSFIFNLSAAKVFGLSSVALTGAYSDLTGLPNLSLYYLNSNPAGYISGITGPMVNAALGYVPYDGATNPNGYISSIPAWSFNNTPVRTIQTVAAAANGFQLSTTRNSDVHYSVSINTSVSLSGNSSGYVVLEIAATNSSSAGAWTEIARAASGQSGTLVIGLVLNQVGGGCLSGSVPAGYYTRLRSINVAGTPTYTYNSGQEILK